LTALLLVGLSSVARSDEPEPAEDPTDFAEPRLDFRLDHQRAAIGIRGGWSGNRARGEIYEFMVEHLTLEKSDFSAPIVIFDVSARVTSYADVVFGLGVSATTKRDSEDRTFNDIEGNPVTQTTQLVHVPLMFSLKLYPIGRERQISRHAWVRDRVVPYLGGGIGATYYKLKQWGDFVDIGDPLVVGDEVIFEDEFTSDGWGFAQHVFGGIDIKLTPGIGLILETRYDWAKADVGGSYEGFEDIELNGLSVLIGFAFKL